MAKKLNNELTRMVAELNEAPFDGSKSLERCELFLLAAAYAGTTSPTKIASASGLSRAECSALANTARSSGIFTGYKIAGADWLDQKTGGIAFIMDAMVLDGTLERVPA